MTVQNSFYAFFETNMSPKLLISQIYIPNHKQASNFVSLYQETIRNDQPVNLFMIVEIKGEKKFEINLLRVFSMGAENE